MDIPDNTVIRSYITSDEADLSFETPLAEWASEYAIDVLVSLGLSGTDHDELGDPLENHVQSLLMMLAVRCPSVADKLATSQDHFTEEAFMFKNGFERVLTAGEELAFHNGYLNQSRVVETNNAYYLKKKA